MLVSRRKDQAKPGISPPIRTEQLRGGARKVIGVTDDGVEVTWTDAWVIRYQPNGAFPSGAIEVPVRPKHAVGLKFGFPRNPSSRRIRIARRIFIKVPQVLLQGDAILVQIAFAFNDLGSIFGFGEGRQQQRCQNRDDGDDDEQFD